MSFLPQEQVRHAVDLQARAYRLLQWMESALKRGFIAPDAANRYASEEDGASAWMARHWLNFPDAARPQKEDLPAFSRLFSTFLKCTFDLEPEPGNRLYSEDAHCFCPCCSFLVRAPYLRPKKVKPNDKKVADSLRRRMLQDLAADKGAILGDEPARQLMADPALREPIGLCTYASDLLQRLEGSSQGAASLALWRSFAWTIEGSPKHGFQLSADSIFEAKALLWVRIRERIEDET